MRYALCAATTVLWGLWAGGLFGLFVSVQRLFERTGRATAAEAASQLFLVFERNQLILAAALVLLAAVWRVVVRGRSLAWLVAVLALAAAGASVQAGLITPRMEELHRAEQTRSPQFRRLHAKSMTAYLATAGLVLAAGAILPAAIARTLRPDQPPPGPAER